ncbi:MAG: hypothetical protein ACTSXA_07010 [Candidatus Heimdallarchaeota archaeon]
MSNAELFDVLKDQLFDRLVNFDTLRKEIFNSLIGFNFDKIGEVWGDFAENCATALNQIATSSRLERYEYQETITENIKSLRNNPKALAVVTRSRDESILQEFLARALSLLYFETIIEGVNNGPKNSKFIKEYANQSQKLSELILFSLGKELQFDEKYLQIINNIGKVNFESNLSDQINQFDSQMKKAHKSMILERKIKNLRYKATLYKDSYVKILDLAKDQFWWDDQILRFHLFSKAESIFTEARDLLLKDPVDPSLLMTIDLEIGLCQGQSKMAVGEYYLELAINSLIKDTHQKAYDYFLESNKCFNESMKILKKIPVESALSIEIIEQIESNLDFSELFITLLALSNSIIELSSKTFPKKELQSQLESLTSLSETPLNNIEFYSQSEFLNTTGFILENLTTLSKHEKLDVERIQAEIKKGFSRLGKIYKGRIDNIGRSFLQLPWEDEKKDIEVKKAFCEAESEKLQDIIISILLMPPFVDDRDALIAKSRVMLNIANSELFRFKGNVEKNATKALSLLVKSYVSAKEAFDNLKKGKVLKELQNFIKEEFCRTFVQSHLKEASILQTGNQYFFARYLLRTLPDILGTLDLNKIPEDIATLIIENHGAMFDSMITIWERLSSHYNVLLQHNKKYKIASQGMINWDYIEKKRDHTKGAMLFFKSCQAVVQAQEFATIKDRVKAEKLFNNGDKFARESAHLFNSVIDTLKGEVQQMPKDLYNFASFCKNQGIKVSQGKKIDDLPIKDFVVLIGIISASL